MASELAHALYAALTSRLPDGEMVNVADAMFFLGRQMKESASILARALTPLGMAIEDIAGEPVPTPVSRRAASGAKKRTPKKDITSAPDPRQLKLPEKAPENLVVTGDDDFLSLIENMTFEKPA